MPVGGHSQNYLGSLEVERKGEDDKVFVKIYNNTGSALANGASVLVVMTPDTTTGFFPTIANPATDAAGISQGGVVASDKGATIPDKAWGWVQIRGYCDKITTAATVVATHSVKLTNAQKYVTTEAATTVTALTFAKCIVGCTGAGTITGYIYGYRTTV